jgi:undecaprenyl diphosphate synthase
LAELKDTIDKERLPSHIAVIMDGNGRWAMEKGMNRVFGHEYGVESVRRVAEACAELGVECLTLYAFSTENWKRPKYEVDALMELLVRTISGEMKTFVDNNISVHAIGDLAQLPDECRAELQLAMNETAIHTGLKLILALSYSSRWDILNACRTLAEKAANGEVSPIEINDNLFKTYLTTARFPDPELLIRTSGEHRISNFLLWELAYTELYFCDKLWPDFEKNDLYTAILDYQGRERRFGLTSEQLR